MIIAVILGVRVSWHLAPLFAVGRGFLLLNYLVPIATTIADYKSGKQSLA